MVPYSEYLPTVLTNYTMLHVQAISISITKLFLSAAMHPERFTHFSLF
jgi:hypothetical protein